MTIGDEFVAYAAAKLALGDEPGPRAWLDTSDVATYVTDENGILVYANEELNTFTIVLPIYGGAGNMKIGNIANAKNTRTGTG